MGFSIEGSDPSQRTLQQTQQRLLATMRHVAAGKRITSAADDAAGLAIAARLDAIERSQRQGVRNLADGDRLAATAEGGLAHTADLLSRMRELSVEARNDTLSNEDRVLIQQQYDELAAEVTRTAASTAFGDRPLLDGSLVGPDAVTLHDGRGPTTTIAVADQSAEALAVAGRSVSDPATLAALDQAIDRVSSARASLGTAQVAIRHESAVVASGADAAAASRSRIEDADFAYELAQRTRDGIVRSAGIAVQVHRGHSAATPMGLLA